MKKKHLLIIVIVIIILAIIVPVFVYANCNLVSRHEMGLYSACKIWKDSGYLDENFPSSMFVQPNINEEYTPPISKEEIISQTKEKCDSSLSQYAICETTGLWK